MATATFSVTANLPGTTHGPNNPGDSHLPVGHWHPGTGLSWLSRVLLKASINFAGMTSINEARLYLSQHTAAGFHAKGSGVVPIVALRKTGDWWEGSGGEGSGADESWGGDATGVINADYVWDSVNDQGNVDNGAGDTNWVYISITQMVRNWHAGAPNYGLMLTSNELGSGASAEFYARNQGAFAPYIWIDYSTNTPPNAPTGLSPTGSEVRHTGGSVVFTGARSDADSGDYITGYNIQLFNDAEAFIVETYDYPGGTPTTFSRTYTGMGTHSYYKWRARTRDRNNEWGPFSGMQRFILNSVPNTPLLSIAESPTNSVPTLTPTLRMTHQDPDPTDTKMHAYQIALYSGGSLIWVSGTVGVTPASTVSRVYNGPALQWGQTYTWRAMTQDSLGAWSGWSGFFEFTTRKTSIPTSLTPTGGAVVGGLVPTFAGARGSSNDSLTSAQVQVYSNDGVTLIWDSGTFTSGVTSSGFSKAYAGSTLAYSTTYKWRARATASTGGTSDWSALQTFATPAANAILTTAPVGSGITDLTPNFEFSRTDSFNAYQIVLYAENGTTVVWDSGTVGHTSATSRSITYPGTPALAWFTTYKWKVRVSSDGGSTWGNGYTSLVTFSTDEAGTAQQSSPSTSAWLGAPLALHRGESLTGVTGSASSTVTLDTATFEEGAASLKAAIAALNGATDAITMAGAWDLSDYGKQTIVKASVRCSSVTNITNIRLRFTDGAGAYVEYDVKPVAAGAFETLTDTKGTPVATSGTIDWSDIVSIKVRPTTSTSKTFDMWVDNIRLDATNPSFDGTSSGGETIATARVIVYAADQTTEVWDSGDVAGSGTTFSIVYAGPALTPGAQYYWKARYIDAAGPTGAYSALAPFKLNSVPSAPTNLSPSPGAIVGATPQFKATFADNELSLNGDAPTEFMVEVYRNSDSVLMHTLRGTAGLVAGENSLQRTTEGTALSYEVEYKWRARYADSFGQYGAWTSYAVFKPSEPPVGTITSPTTTINSPSFPVTWSYSSPGGKTQNRFRILITRDDTGVMAYDSGLVFSSQASHTVPGGYLVNNTDYTVSLVVYDSDGLVSNGDTEDITSSWTAPSAITGLSVSVIAEESHLRLDWDISNLAEAEFSFYQIYRREPGDAGWTAYARITNQSETSYKDYFAANAQTYEYKVTVWKIVVGDVDIESADSDIPTATLDSDTWFVVGADRDASHIFELPVFDEDHSEPIQQEVFEPLGSRRKSIVRGKVLGEEGTLQVRWIESEVAAAKLYLRYLADNPGPHILKSPFGDVWEVEFSGPAKKYSGGGHMGTTLTWIEVT